ncbi:MAG: oxygen-independent coproporphyrinogen III oxidase [Alphaproteobacteria bacterium]|nr:oxygen-independent coproporphyrinogen III oxidase [Alphaproteobacteria bacterium]
MTYPAHLFAARVPRYTSYPTAPHFHSGIRETTYRAWLAALPEEIPLSLYLHVPFCDTLCWFCGCHTKIVNNYRLVGSYCDLLAKEVEMVADALGARRRVTHIHWGGGSPTLLSPTDLARLTATMRRRFDIAGDAECAIEIDPRGFDGDTAWALAEAGVTRASIGVQDCDPRVQKAINRIQSDAETEDCVRLLRAAGISRLNLDLIYGLPYQTKDSIRRNIAFALSLNPDRLAVFGYAHVPAFKKHQALIPEHALPGVAERLAQEELIHDLLCEAGYVAVGLDHYARPGDPMAQAAADGTLARNFQGYTTDTAPALIGFGASAIGSLPQGYAQNEVAIPAWRAAIEAGGLATARGIELTFDDRVRRHVIERLMCDFSVDLKQVRRRFHLPCHYFADALDRLQPLVAEAAVTLDGDTVTVNPQMRPAVRLAAAAFDAWLDGGNARHAMTA